MFVRLAQLISRINLAKAQRIDSFKIANSKVNFSMVYKLEELGILRGFFVEEGNILRVDMKFVRKRAPFVKLWLVGKSSRSGSISLERLRLLSDKNGSSIYILSTGRGFLTHTECFTLKCCGEVVVKIDL